jgi:dipeptidyl aminopeptidase/acylaminoacyl peptidase
MQRSQDDTVWLLFGSSGNYVPAFYSYDRAQRRARLLFLAVDDLADQPLVPMEPVSFTARDGLTIHGYLTLPRDWEPPGPMVLKVHGGPWTRDYWGFDPETQWLANRGYAVLQVNYRGSAGYGKEFLNAGKREWGGKMQDDLTDAVK